MKKCMRGTRTVGVPVHPPFRWRQIVREWMLVDICNVHLVFKQPFCGVWADKAGHETSLTMAHNFGFSFSAHYAMAYTAANAVRIWNEAWCGALLKGKNTKIQLQAIQVKVNFALLLSPEIGSLQRSKAFAKHAISHGPCTDANTIVRRSLQSTTPQPALQCPDRYVKGVNAKF